MIRATDAVVLVTSGLGNRYGGIGVVSQQVHAALAMDHKVTVWRHLASLPSPVRVGALAAQAMVGALWKPAFVLYDHVHLASMHRILPQLRSVPYGILLHGTEVWEKLDGQRRDAISAANILIANSATTVAIARRVNPWLPHVEVTWLGVPRHGPGIRAGELMPAACIIGRMVRGELKGHDAILDAWPQIRSAFSGAVLRVIGSGDDESRLRRRVAAERLEGIEFTGHISDERRDQICCNSRVFLFPSTQEGFGLAAIEAASWGVPVIGLAGTVLSELFPADAAVFLPELRAELVASATIQLFTDQNSATKIGETGRRRVQECFLEEHFIARFRQAMARVLS